MNRFIIFCEPCGHKQIVEEDPRLVSVKRASVPGGIPYVDYETKKVKEKEKTTQPNMYKCPKCGRGVILKRLPEVYSKTIDDIEKQRQEEEDKRKEAERKNQEN